MDKIKIGIIICDRYKTCAGGKCFRAASNREGAFSVYKDFELEIAAFTTCGGCPGGNIEYTPEEMIKNGITRIHFATGFLVGYPPCPYIEHFKKFIQAKYGIEVIIGTHPVPQKYFSTHMELKSWNTEFYEDSMCNVIGDEMTRLSYD
jgi:predicted metal-binding protein